MYGSRDDLPLPSVCLGPSEAWNEGRNNAKLKHYLREFRVYIKLTAGFSKVPHPSELPSISERYFRYVAQRNSGYEPNASLETTVHKRSELPGGAYNL